LDFAIHEAPTMPYSGVYLAYRQETTNPAKP